jgi:hypothetical protein
MVRQTVGQADETRGKEDGERSADAMPYCTLGQYY